MVSLIRTALAAIAMVLLVGAGPVAAPAGVTNGIAVTTAPMEACTRAWSESVGSDVVQDVWAYSVDASPEFVAWLLAVAWEESHMDPAARSPAGALGMLQLTPQGALEAALTCGLPKLTGRRQLDQLLDRRRSIVYGSCLLKKYLSESDGNWSAALMLYNGGYRQLELYLGQRRLTAETQNYVRDVFYMRYACGPLVPPTRGAK